MRVATLLLGLPMLVAACAAAPISEVALDAAQGTRWLVDTIGAEPVLDGVQCTLEFESPERVVGNTGCNQFQGPVAARDGGIVIGPLATTRRACAEEVMDQERRYTDALARARGLRIVGSRLELFDANGESLARLSRMTTP